METAGLDVNSYGDFANLEDGAAEVQPHACLLLSAQNQDSAKSVIENEHPRALHDKLGGANYTAHVQS